MSLSRCVFILNDDTPITAYARHQHLDLSAHLLLFCLAFVFGSFCTFCFHMLMYMFNGKCVLFPKLLSLNSMRHNTVYDFVPRSEEKDTKTLGSLPLDFLTTYFAHKSVCYLPMYVPLASGIFGLVWTTMFLMCSSGSRSLSDMHRPWRVIPPVIVFSMAMSILCIYSSVITYQGLEDLCSKLRELTGNKESGYTINLATLAYERQIRGVYQATRLTIISAWMHTACWIASALLAIVRIFLAVDFRLVKIRAELIGDIDRMLELNEEHLQTVLPSRWADDDSNTSAGSRVYSHFKNERFDKAQEFGTLIDFGSDVLFISDHPIPESDQALLPEERDKSALVHAYSSVPKEHHFIINLLYGILDLLGYDDSSTTTTMTESSSLSSIASITRQFGQQIVSSKTRNLDHPRPRPFDIKKDDEVFIDLKQLLQLKPQAKQEDPTPSTSKKGDRSSFESLMNLTAEMRKTMEDKFSKTVSDKEKSPEHKADVKDAAIQTKKTTSKSSKKQKVTISEKKDTFDSSLDNKTDENTQREPKEKQD